MWRKAVWTQRCCSYVTCFFLLCCVSSVQTTISWSQTDFVCFFFFPCFLGCSLQGSPQRIIFLHLTLSPASSTVTPTISMSSFTTFINLLWSSPSPAASPATFVQHIKYLYLQYIYIYRSIFNSHPVQTSVYSHYLITSVVFRDTKWDNFSHCISIWFQNDCFYCNIQLVACTRVQTTQFNNTTSACSLKPIFVSSPFITKIFF